MKLVYSDIDLDLRRKTDGDIERFTEMDAIISSVKNILGTMQGSRRMLPSFALPIYSLLFEPIDEPTAQRIGESLLEAINIWDDRIIITDVLIQAFPDQNQYKVTLTMIIKETSEEVQVEHVLEAI